MNDIMDVSSFNWPCSKLLFAINKSLNVRPKLPFVSTSPISEAIRNKGTRRTCDALNSFGSVSWNIYCFERSGCPQSHLAKARRATQVSVPGRVGSFRKLQILQYLLLGSFKHCFLKHRPLRPLCLPP